MIGGGAQTEAAVPLAGGCDGAGGQGTRAGAIVRLDRRVRRCAYAFLLACVFAGLALGHSSQALAVDLKGEKDLITETVAGRERRKDYDNAKQYGASSVSELDRVHVQPHGLRVRNYTVFPSVKSAIAYDDNVFGSSRNEVSDFRTEVTPELHFNSRFARHVLDFSLGGKLVNYFDNSSQDFADYNAAVRGALHFDHAHTLAASVISELNHEERYEITAPRFATEPTPVLHHRAVAGITRDVGRLYGTFSLSADRYDYFDVSGEGGTIDQDYRDLDIFAATLNAGYRFSPGYELVGKVRLMRQFSDGVGVNNFDADGFDVLGGVEFETGPLLRWRLLAGYGVRDYDEPGRNNLSSSLFEGEVEWLATQKMTVTANASRELVDTVGADVGGHVETSFGAKVDYEIYNNLVAHAGIEYSQADFEADTRLDDTVTARLGLEYYLNRNWVVSFDYDYRFRDSSDDDFDLERNVFRVGAKYQY